MAIGKTLEEAMEITNETVAKELGGLPKNKLHCSNLGADALHAAIEDYRKKLKGEPAPGAEKAPSPKSKECHCPYCDGPLEGMEGICGSCHVELEECPHCGQLTKKGDEKCAQCGAELNPA
jgi:nitrogen fixation NifU-like protein